ncbi:MAG TPA: histidinol-phosphatase HisJ family protein [Candidatus Limnocylindrales bacterium]
MTEHAPTAEAETPAVDPQATNLPLDSHLHTDQSFDSQVPIDVYGAMAAERGIAELAITDHIDFDPRWLNYNPDFALRESIVRAAAERWAEHGVAIRFGLEVSYESSREEEIREHLRTHAYDFVIGSVHVSIDSPYHASRVRSWVAGRSLDEIVAPSFDEVIAAARSGLFDTIGHLDSIKRYLLPHVAPAQLADRPDLYEAMLVALVESGTGLEVNTSGLRQGTRETYPSPAVVARFRALGGQRVTAGSDAHRPSWFAHGLDAAYQIAADAGFEDIAFRRGPGGPVSVAIPDRFRE